MRWLAVVAMLALPLAGCLSPTVPPDLPSGDPASEATQAGPASPVPAAHFAASADKDERAFACPPEPQRTEETELRQVIVTVEGCAALVEPVLATNLPDDLRIGFDTRAGAQHLLVMFQPHGPEPARARLTGPWPRLAMNASDEGNEDRNTLVRFEVPQPPAGAWELRGWIDDLAVARQWTTTIVVTY